VNLFDYINPLIFVIIFCCLIVVIGFYLLQREITRRRRVEYILRRQAQRERLVHQITQQIRQSLNIEEVLKTTVTEVRNFLQADRVLIYRIWDDGTGSAMTENVLSPYPEILGVTFPEEVFPQEYHQAYIGGKIRAINNVEQADVEDCLAEFVRQFGVKAKLVVPIIQEIRKQNLDVNNRDVLPAPPTSYLWGLLIAHQCNKARRWEQEEIELMKQLATQVAIAIQQSELYTQLQQLNSELEHRVQQRTEELALSNESLKAEIIERQRTEAALRHTNHTLQSLIAASPRAIFTLDLQDRVKIWNPAAERIFGWKEGEVKDSPNPVISEESVEEYKIIKQSILQGITPSSLEIGRQKKDGSNIDIVFSAAPLTDSEGKINGMVAVVADITEQKRQAEQVRLLQSVAVNTNDAIIITEARPIDEPGPRILYVNKAFTKMTGYTLEEVLGKTPRLLQGPKTSRCELDKVRLALSQWQSVTVEVINYRKDGSEFWSEFNVVPVTDKAGHCTHWISIQRETTERKLNEEALRLSEGRFRQVVENALDIITILEPNGAIHYQSPSVEKVLGYTSEQFRSENFFAYIHEEDLANIRSGIIEAIEDHKIVRPIEFRCRHQEGGWLNLEAIAQKFIDDAPKTRIVVTSRDISERKRLEEVRIALEQEKELNMVKTRFFSMASHEFRTPLSTVLAAAQVLENACSVSDNAQKQLRNLHRIQNSVKNMVQLLDDILTINRAETGNLEFNPKPIALEKFCRQFIEEIKLSTDTKHELKFTCHGQERINVCLDEKLLRSILANLLSNAIKYSPQASQIDLYLTFSLDKIEFQVQDRGVGILTEDRGEIFEPFYRGLNVRHLTGTGLGLVVVKKCVDLHGGSISIASEIGKGTTVKILLPLID
jgi:PAS domain S-box-containing protein